MKLSIQIAYLFRMYEPCKAICVSALYNNYIMGSNNINTLND